MGIGKCYNRKRTIDDEEEPENENMNQSLGIPLSSIRDFSSLDARQATGSTSYLILSTSARKILDSSELRDFTYDELRVATGNFCNQLGEGGFGYVYKGQIEELDETGIATGFGLDVAVKKMKISDEVYQSQQGWLAEVNYLSRFQHPNIVKLIGFCAENSQRLLVYEYMPNRSLDRHLFKCSRDHTLLSWDIRIKIALGIAKGLAFLHSQRPQVIFRDCKSSNVLLDSDYTAKISDFGMAMDGPTGDRSHVMTNRFGTFGYGAPEFFSTGQLTARSDVYSFGVILMEILSGCQALNSMETTEKVLVEWAPPVLSDKNKRFTIMDKRLGGQYSHDSASIVAEIALSCTKEDWDLRPHMDYIVEKLEALPEVLDIQTDNPHNTTDMPNLGHQPNIEEIDPSGSTEKSGW
ncbi:receptor-like cytoplasmic kinase 176 [Tasmannia lanceolata]|uniref:receptor-like cytoplasmic kinase 176 n=1 Tax=Tasmannia lanceolata TaxID=3420 RepID=UPI0040640DC8